MFIGDRKMNNKGFTNIEIFLVIVVFSAIYLVSMVGFSSAFEPAADTASYEEAVYDAQINLLLGQAESYAQANSHLFMDTTVIYTYVNELVSNNYFQDGTDLGNLKIKIVKTDNVYTASVVEI